MLPPVSKIKGDAKSAYPNNGAGDNRDFEMSLHILLSAYHQKLSVDTDHSSWLFLVVAKFNSQYFY